MATQAHGSGMRSRENEGGENRPAVPAIDLAERRNGRGVIWVNSSHENLRYVREAERSAQTVRLFVDQAEFVLVSDQFHQRLDPVFDFQALGRFFVPDCIKHKVHYNGQMIAKLSVLKKMTWEKNLYLGSDIAALRPGIEDIFRLLDDFDIVVTHAHARKWSSADWDERILGLPKSFPEMNCDLIAYRRTAEVGDFLREWERIYANNEIEFPHDQGAFRYLLLESKLRMYILPPEYNYRSREFWEEAVILQRRTAIPAYRERYPHIAEIYGSTVDAPDRNRLWDLAELLAAKRKLIDAATAELEALKKERDSLRSELDADAPDRSRLRDLNELLATKRKLIDAATAELEALKRERERASKQSWTA